MRQLRSIIQTDRGTILIETAVVCLVLVVILVFCLETFTLITTQINIQKVAREGARETAIVGDFGDGGIKAIDAGLRKADMIIQQCLKNEYPSRKIYLSNVNGRSYVICDVAVEYRFLKHIRTNGVGGKILDARAIYPWYDENSKSNP